MLKLLGKAKDDEHDNDAIINVPYFLDQTPRLLIFFLLLKLAAIIQGRRLLEGGDKYLLLPSWVKLLSFLLLPVTFSC